MNKEQKSINAQIRAGTWERNQEIRRLARIQGNGYEKLTKQFKMSRAAIRNIVVGEATEKVKGEK